MNVTLALVGLHHEEVRCVSGNMVLVTGSVPAQDFLQSLKIHQQCPQQARKEEAKMREKKNSLPDACQRTITVLSLDHRNHLRGVLLLVLQTCHLCSRQSAIRSISGSVSQFHLN